MRKSLYYQHTLKLLVLEGSLAILACTVSSPTFCVVMSSRFQLLNGETQDVNLTWQKIIDLGLKISANQFLRAKCRPRAITRSQVSAQIPAAIFQSLVRDREQILNICVGMIGPIKDGV